MCNRIKSALQIRCAKTVYWDLINSNMHKRDVQEGCANGLYRVCTHSSNTDDENMNVLQLIMSLVSVYETGFALTSLMALREEAPPQSLSFCHHAPEALARWQ